MILEEHVTRRRDALRNRAALVAAAETEFALQGPDVPLDAVVRRAGVGRGTLYRHFEGRIDLAIAIYDQHTSDYEAFVAEHDEPETVFLLLARMADVQARARGVSLVLARETGGEDRIMALVARTRTLFETALERGRAAGLIAPDVTPDDLLLVLGMLEGALVGVPLEQAPAVAQRVIQFVTPALRAGSTPA